MARILLIGGHGKVGLRSYPHLIQRGHHVTGVIRNPDHAAEIERTGAFPLVADVETLDTPGFEALMQGVDVIVWSAGAGGGNPDRTYAVDRDAAIRSMIAAENAGVKRYIMVSYHRASPHHGVDPSNSFFHYAEAKAAADEYLRSSNLDWTILGPSALTLDPGSGTIELEGESASVSRENVATVIAETVERDSLIHKTVRFNDGDTPIAEALTSAGEQ